MVNERGLRSSNDAKPWKCKCGTINHPKKGRFFDVPAWECRGRRGGRCGRRCKRKFNGSFKFCLGEIEIDDGSLIGDPWNQRDDHHLVHGPFCDDEAWYPQSLEDEEIEDNHMCNEKLHHKRATFAPVLGPESGTRSAATDGGPRGLNSADSGTVFGGSPDACGLATGDLVTLMSRLTVAGGGEAVPEAYTEEALQAGSASAVSLSSQK